jgi:Arc/MetJ-type ribon-helix-helix transcriptional regulator
MTSVVLTEDLECFIRDAVSTGRYASADSMISDALIQLRNATATDVEKSAQGAENSRVGKQLTKQEFQRHLVKIGLLDQPGQTGGGSDDSDETLIDNEGEIVSEAVIRERLIEWLTGFL